MDTTNESGRDEQMTEDTAGHALKTDRAIDFDLLGTQKPRGLEPQKHLAREIPPGVIADRRKIAG